MSFLKALFKGKETAGESAQFAGQIGVLFDIGDLDDRQYGRKAYQIFFKHLDPKSITGSRLYHGDTRQTLAGRENHYCIAVKTMDLSQINYVRKTISFLNDKGLLPKSMRFIDGEAVGREPLEYAGEIDGAGNFAAFGNGMICESWAEGSQWNIVKF